MPTKVLFKNLLIFMNPEHQSILTEFLKLPDNESLNMTLEPILQTDQNGLITMFKPTGRMTQGLVQFFQNLMLEQRCFLLDEFLRKQGEIK